MILLTTVLVATEIVLMFYFVYPWILKILKVPQKKTLARQGSEVDYAIIVTAYKNIDIIRGFLLSLKNINYTNFVVYVVADNCGDIDLGNIGSRVVVLVPPHALHDNVKSHRYAIENFVRQHERITIIDSDNILHPEYFVELNKVFENGFQAVQGVRDPRNFENELAKLDALNDLYYRYIDRKLLFEAGSSAALSGSGMAFDSKLYKEFTSSYSSNGAGFDKFLQNEIVMNGHRIAFATDAIVLDQKISKTEALVKQRARWIRTWFKSLRYSFTLLFFSIQTRNRNAFLFSIAVLRPPLFILFGSVFCFLIINSILIPMMNIFLILSVIAGIACFFHALHIMKARKTLVEGLMSVPKFFYLQLRALGKVRIADKISVATAHEIQMPHDQESVATLDK